jgi:hypothetical protein
MSQDILCTREFPAKRARGKAHKNIRVEQGKKSTMDIVWKYTKRKEQQTEPKKEYRSSSHHRYCGG